ncbi:MAG: carboxypeptidase M32 [Planctomycetaceae bacterium]
MSDAAEQTYAKLLDHLRQTAVLESCGSLLGWDEQTYMPSGGAEHRARQLSLLAGLVHERATAPVVGEMLSEIEASTVVLDPDSSAAANIREARRDFDRATKLPRRLVEELAQAATLGQHAWVEARKRSSFLHFLPWLEKIVTLKREEAQAIGYGAGVPYDALLDTYESGTTSAEIARLFDPLRDELVNLIAAIRDSGVTPRREILTRHYPVDSQREFSLAAAKQIGFDFTEGRLDVAAHPFCSGIGPGDVRLTTRYNERHFPGAFFGTLHEAGHGIYEQNLERTAFGTPVGQACSLGIHESQSRMWENFVGRSRAFWTHFFPRAQAAFPEALADVAVDDFYRAINDVQPSFIRVEADEATYNLHILLRFDLERPLVAGDLQPADVPAAWNETFVRYFGLTPPDAAQGCLQDIHWSGGMIGYFPTYALGNMYAGQLFADACRDLDDLPGDFARGEFGALRCWLNEEVHRHGKHYRAAQLVEQVTGAPLSHKPLIEHLRSKYSDVYRL